MQLQDRLIPGVRIPTLALISLVALIMTASVMISAVFGVLGASMEDSVEADQADVVKRILASNRLLETSEDRFTGRSIFYIPKAPRLPTPPPPPREPVVVQERPAPPPPAPPRIPATYGGPDVTGILGMDVFFDNGKRIPEGAEADGIEVLEIETPFDVRIGWRGGTYTVSLFTEELPDYFSEAPFANGGASNLLTLEMAPADDGGSTVRPSRPRPGSTNSAPGAPRSPGAGAIVQVPDPITEDALEKMDRLEAIKALTSINSAMRLPELDNETRERLTSERTRLQDRIRELTSG